MGRCYQCNKYGHRSYECPDNPSTSQGGAHIAHVEDESVRSPSHEDTLEVGESLLMKRILLKPSKEFQELAQRKILLITMCKTRGKCCSHY